MNVELYRINQMAIIMTLILLFRMSNVRNVRGVWDVGCFKRGMFFRKYDLVGLGPGGRKMFAEMFSGMRDVGF